MAELTAAERPVLARVRAALGNALLVAAAVLSFLCLMALIGAWRNDVAISSHTGKATAEVVSVSLARTIIRFTTPDGEVHSPRTGVLYPGGLAPGQLVRIEYDVRNPELVKVENRDASQGVLPALATAGTGWLVLAPAGLWLRRGSRAGGARTGGARARGARTGEIRAGGTTTTARVGGGPAGAPADRRRS